MTEMTRKPSITEMQAVKQEQPVFNPSKKYTWAATEVFQLSGHEIDILNKVLAIQTQEIAQYDKFLALREGLLLMNKILEEGFKEGIIKEVVAPKAEEVTVVTEE